MPFRRALLLVMFVSALAAPATGEDAWNPFKDSDQKPRAKRVRPTEPAQPNLPTMDGVASKPWDRPSDGAARAPGDGPAGHGTSTGQTPGYGQPYGPPGQVIAPGTPAAQPAAASAAIERQALPPLDEKGRAVDRNDLSTTTAAAADSAGLPNDVWQGIDIKTVEGLVAELELPPRSPAMNTLWQRLWTAPAAGPETGHAHFDALRMEALYRSGRAKEAAAIASQSDTQPPLIAALGARLAIAAGDLTKGCAAARGIAKAAGDVPQPIKTEMLLLAGYCAAAEGKSEAAGLAADLARAEANASPLALAALDAIAAGQPFKPQLPKRLALIDYRFLQLAKSANPIDAAERAEPALLVALAEAPEAEPRLKVAAGELAARNNALDPAKLGSLYRAQTFSAAELADPLAAKTDQALRRALLFKAGEAERTPMRKTRIVRALLDDARRIGLAFPVSVALAEIIADVKPAQEIGWFAETAIEISLAASRYDTARAWAAFAARDRGDASHWGLLIDIADPKWPGRRGEGFQHVEPLALRGRLPNDLMHRLVTVLDALDYQIPIPLWEAASKTPQPATGHLPETGVLATLQSAANKKEFARTVLAAMRALGPATADGAHMIALGDTVRALRRAGLETEARRLALEAVFTGWPRTAAN